MATKTTKTLKAVKTVKKVKAPKGGTKYAVIRLQGHQYKVKEGEELLVDHLGSDKATAEVLLTVDGSEVSVGTPLLAKAVVKLKVLKELEKGEKLMVFKYKAKSRFRKKKGFRHTYSRLLIEKITA